MDSNFKPVGVFICVNGLFWHVAADVFENQRPGETPTARKYDMQPRSNALDILNERYARGNVKREEYGQPKLEIASPSERETSNHGSPISSAF